MEVCQATGGTHGTLITVAKLLRDNDTCEIFVLFSKETDVAEELSPADISRVRLVQLLYIHVNPKNNFNYISKVLRTV